MKELDCIIVGSGCSGAMAAQTLVEAGLDVTMLDGGILNTDDNNLPAGKDFLFLRKNDEDQYKYTIGSHTQGLSWGAISKGAQVTPPRQYIAKSTHNLIPLSSQTFSPLESLSYGGLGIGWGLQCWEYSEADLEKVGLDSKRIQQAYETVAQRIGISATRDEAAKYTINSLSSFQPSADADRNHSFILSRFKKHKKSFQKKGVFIGRTPLALITGNLGIRKPYRYLETDFYSDADQSAWRPWITINMLRKSSNFHYVGGLLVTSFKEKNDAVIVSAINIASGKIEVYQCKNLILATGALGSARIALRSQAKFGSKTSLLSNPHSYIPCIQPRFFGKGYETKKLGFGQASYFIDPDGNDSGISVASSYSYQSLMLFRIIMQIPLNLADSRIISRYLTPGLVILIAQHPDYVSKNKYLQLVKDPSSPTGDKIEANYELDEKDLAEWDDREKNYVSIMRKLGTFPIKRVKTEHGSAIHYAGTLPFSDENEKLHLAPNGRLGGTKHIFVADSSGFKFLPAKGLTFTIMANAHTVAENVISENAQ